MLQFYFLSVLLNLIAGFILIYASDYSGVKNDLESADSSGSEDDFQELSEEEKSTSEKNSDSKKSKKSLLPWMLMKRQWMRLWLQEWICL